VTIPREMLEVHYTAGAVGHGGFACPSFSTAWKTTQMQLHRLEGASLGAA
jgi:hypothetical protein